MPNTASRTTSRCVRADRADDRSAIRGVASLHRPGRNEPSSCRSGPTRLSGHDADELDPAPGSWPSESAGDDDAATASARAGPGGETTATPGTERPSPHDAPDLEALLPPEIAGDALHIVSSRVSDWQSSLLRRAIERSAPIRPNIRRPGPRRRRRGCIRRHALRDPRRRPAGAGARVLAATRTSRRDSTGNAATSRAGRSGGLRRRSSTRPSTRWVVSW